MEAMPKFVAIGYGDDLGYRRTNEAVRADAHAHDATFSEWRCRDGYRRTGCADQEPCGEESIGFGGRVHENGKDDVAHLLEPTLAEEEKTDGRAKLP